MAGSRPPKRPRLLSLDGGGLLGLSELLGIKEMMDRLTFDLKLDHTPKPRDFFELAAGNGTGGLNAILLCRLGFTVHEAINHYIRIVSVAFSANRLQDAAKIQLLRDILEVVVKDAGLEKTTKMKDVDSEDIGCKMFVCAQTPDNLGHARLFRSYRGRSSNSYNCTIIDAMLICLSSPGYLQPISIGEPDQAQYYTDASMGFNNPIGILIQESVELFGIASDIRVIMSFGSGKDATVFPQTSESIPDKLIAALAYIERSCESAHQDWQRRTNGLGIYYRFNVEKHLQLHNIREWSQSSLIVSFTQEYYLDAQVSDRLDEALKALQRESDLVKLKTIAYLGQRNNDDEAVLYQDKTLLDEDGPFETKDIPKDVLEKMIALPVLDIGWVPGEEENLRIYLQDTPILNNIRNILVNGEQGCDSEGRRYSFVRKEDAQFEINVEDDYITFHFLDSSISKYGFTQLPFKVRLQESTASIIVDHVIQEAARFDLYLRYTNITPTLREFVRVEFHKVKRLGFDKSWRRIIQDNSQNLIVDNKVEVIEGGDEYGIKIFNDSPFVLYPHLFYFDCSDLSIDRYYPITNETTTLAPLQPGGVASIGYGAKDLAPWRYFCRNEEVLMDGEVLQNSQDMDVGFLKLFVTAFPMDLSLLKTASPFKSLARPRGSERVEDSLEIWDTILLPIIQRREVKTQTDRNPLRQREMLQYL